MVSLSVVRFPLSEWNIHKNQQRSDLRDPSASLRADLISSHSHARKDLYSMRSSCESMATPRARLCGSNPSHFLPSNSTAPNWATKTRKSSQPDFKGWPPKKQLFQQELDRQALFRESAVRLRRDVWGGRPGGGEKFCGLSLRWGKNSVSAL